MKQKHVPAPDGESAAAPASEPETKLAVVSPARSIVLTPGMALTECPTSLNINDPVQRAMLFNAGNPADYQIQNGQPVRIKAVHWLAYPEERIDEKSGEVVQYGVLVLFDAAGKTFKTTSEYAPRRLRAALELYGAEEWRRGVTFEVTPRPSKRHPGGTYHDIRICVDESAVLL